MNQIMRVGEGVVIAIGSKVPEDVIQHLSAMWQDKMPDVPAIFISEAQVVQRDGQPVLFEFTGEVSPTMVAEFQRWWEEMSSGA